MTSENFIEIQISKCKIHDFISLTKNDIAMIHSFLHQIDGSIFWGMTRAGQSVHRGHHDDFLAVRYYVSRQSVAVFNAILVLIAEQNKIDVIEAHTAHALKELQRQAQQNGFLFKIRTSLENSPIVTIDGANSLQHTKIVWSEAEFYFYGKAINVRGKDKTHVSFDTASHGIIRIEFPLTLRKGLDQRFYGVRVSGRQDITTGEIDPTSLELIELIDYQQRNNDRYLHSLRRKAEICSNDVHSIR